MPQFIMPLESTAEVVAFNALPAFTRGCVEAMFFTECHADNPELEDATFDDLAPETLAKIQHDCALFEEANRAAIEAASESRGKYAPDYDDESAGRDFWFTRNHHGVGFWDRGLPAELDEALTDAAQGFSSIDLYRGDDGKVYLS